MRINHDQLEEPKFEGSVSVDKFTAQPILNINDCIAQIEHLIGEGVPPFEGYEHTRGHRFVLAFWDYNTKQHMIMSSNNRDALGQYLKRIK